jgi:uncharacterized membrane protein HdeD (DUF308 family)
MIERNLGNIERAVRLILGIAFGVWALMQPQLNGVEWLVIVIALALILNGIFSRCYVWYLFDVNTSKKAPSSTSIC